MRRVVVRVLVNLTAARPVTRGKPRRIPPGPLVCCLVVTLLFPLLPGCGSAGDRVEGQVAESPASPASPVPTAPPAGGGGDASQDESPVDWDSWGDSLPRRIAHGKVTFGPFLSPGRSVD
ncbi:MAG: hypothetical protein ACM3X4_06415 [Ignavibacteriales bacterium]